MCVNKLSKSCTRQCSGWDGTGNPRPQVASPTP